MAQFREARLRITHPDKQRVIEVAPIKLRVRTRPVGKKTPKRGRETLMTNNSHKSNMASPMRILVAPSGFKESLEAETVADSIESGIRRVLPDADVRKVPLHDGGEGFSRALVQATDGILHELKVTGPVGAKISSHIGLIGPARNTAVLDMAAAAGLRLVPKDSRDPSITTTYGVGELIACALDLGCNKIIVGCGDSGTSDGGAGMLQALGARLLDATGRELPLAGGGKDLSRLAKIDMTSIHPRLSSVSIEAVCNWKNVLCGPKGVARVYGPQKGATPEQVECLSAALDNYGSVLSELLGRDISNAPGSGASGGLGSGLMLINAVPRTRYEASMEYFGISDLFRGCQLVFTAEGGLDSQSPQGKITAEVARRAKAQGIKVVALAGTIGSGANLCYDAGIDAFTSILKAPTTLEQAIKDTEKLLKDGAESVMRLILIGSSIQPPCLKESSTSPIVTKSSHDVVAALTPPRDILV